MLIGEDTSKLEEICTLVRALVSLKRYCHLLDTGELEEICSLVRALVS